MIKNGFRDEFKAVSMSLCTMLSILMLTHYPRLVHAEAIQAINAEQYLDSFGVNTHFDSSNTMYNRPDMPAMISDIGFRHVRDNAKTTAGYSILSDLYTYDGIMTTLVVDSTSESYLADVPPVAGNSWVMMVEGLNEPDVFVRSFSGLQDVSLPVSNYLATRQYQHQLYQAIKGYGPTSDKYVLSPAMGYPKYVTSLGHMPYDALTFHRYYAGQYPGSVNYISQEFYYLDTLPNAEGKAIFLTETGYHTAINHTGYHKPVTESIQAKYLPRIMCKAFMEGVSRSFIYELADQGASLSDREMKFGMVAYQSDQQQPLQLKPAGMAIKRLYNHLNDSISPTFLPDFLDFDLEAGAADLKNIRYLVIQENDAAKTFNILIWQEVNSYDTATQQVINNPPINNVTLRFNTLINSIKQYTLSSDSIINSKTNSNRVFDYTMSVTDEIQVLQITPKSTYYVPGTYVDMFVDDDLATENSSDTALIRFVRHNSNLSQSLRAYYRVYGSAINGTDYQSLNGYVDFPENVDTVTVNVTPVNDSLVEGDEKLIVRFYTSPGIYRGYHYTGTITIKDDEAMADLVITDIDWDKVYPKANDPIAFYITVKNQGTGPTTTDATLKFHPDHQGGTWTTRTIAAGLQPGQSVTKSDSYGWHAHAGSTVFEANVFGTFESNINNNHSAKLFTVPFIYRSDDFESGLNTTTWTGWNVTGSWQAITYTGEATNINALRLYEYSSWEGHPIQAVLPVTFSTNFTMDFDYDWEWGGTSSIETGASSNLIGIKLLDDHNNGYLIRIRQGNGNNTVYDNKLTQIYKVTSNTYNIQSPIIQGIGYNQCGFKSASHALPRFKKIHIEYDQIASRLSIYGDADEDGKFELFSQTVQQLDYDRFTKVVFLAYVNNRCTPVLDNVHIMLNNPLDNTALDFDDQASEAVPVNWSVTGNWLVKSRDNNNILEDQNSSSNNPVRYTLPASHDASWEVEFDYDWAWGGNVSGGIAYGFSYMLAHMELLDDNNNGYHLAVRQGNSNNSYYDNQIILLNRVVNGVNDSNTLLTTSGYNQMGWQSRNTLLGESNAGPDSKRIKLMYEPSEQKLTICADTDRDGTMEVMGTVQDTGSVFANLQYLQFYGTGISSTLRLSLDNIRVSQQHTLNKN